MRLSEGNILAKCDTIKTVIIKNVIIILCHIARI